MVQLVLGIHIMAVKICMYIILHVNKNINIYIYIICIKHHIWAHVHSMTGCSILKLTGSRGWGAAGGGGSGVNDGHLLQGLFGRWVVLIRRLHDNEVINEFLKCFNCIHNS